MLNRYGYVCGGTLRALQTFPAAIRGTTGAMLRDGTFVFAGGHNAAGALLSSVYRYNPATQVFSAEAATLLFARGNHVAFPSSDGGVVVVGGTRGVQDYSAQAEIVEVDLTGSLSVTAVGSLVAGRNAAVAAALPSGRGYVALGEGPAGFLSSAEVYDPRTRAFSAAAAAPVARASAGLGRTPSALHLNGGRDAGGVVVGSQYLYNPAADSWAARADTLQPRAFHAALSLLDGTVASVGGLKSTGPDSFIGFGEIYYPELDCSRVDPALALTVKAAGAASGGGHHVIVGGQDSGGTTVAQCWAYSERVAMTPGVEAAVLGGRSSVGASLSTSYKYNSATEAFSAIGPFSAPRDSASAAPFMFAGRLRSLVAGGARSAAVVADAETFDPETEVFSALPVTLSAARQAGAGFSAQYVSTLLDRRAWITGGKNSGGVSVNTVDRFDPATGAFSVAGVLPLALAHHGAADIFDGFAQRAIIAGGLDSGNLLRDEIYMFNPVTGAYALSATLRYPKARMAVASNGRHVVVLAGGTKLLTNDPLNEIDVYTWNAQAGAGARTAFANNLVTPRRDAVALTLTADEILIVGGHGVGSPIAAASSVEKINLRYGTVTQMGILPLDVRYSAAASGFLAPASFPVSIVPATFFTAVDDASVSRSAPYSAAVSRGRVQTYDIQVEEGETVQIVLWARTNAAYSDRASSTTCPEFQITGCGINARLLATDLLDSAWVQKGGVSLSGTATAAGVVTLNVLNRSAAFGARLFVDDIVLA